VKLTCSSACQGDRDAGPRPRQQPAARQHRERDQWNNRGQDLETHERPPVRRQALKTQGLWLAECKQNSLPPGLWGVASRVAARDRHTPRMRGIQYAAASRFYRWRLWNTGSPGIGERKRRRPSDGYAGRRRLRVSSHTFAISRHAMPEGCSEFPALFDQRARGMPGARCARGLVCKRQQKNAHEHTGHTGITRHSPRNGLRLISCSPRRPGFLATVIPEKLSLPGNLTPASGCRAHTILLVRLRRARPSHPPRPSQPAPRT
jgi:hypothetical protein